MGQTPVRLRQAVAVAASMTIEKSNVSSTSKTLSSHHTEQTIPQNRLSTASAIPRLVSRASRYISSTPSIQPEVKRLSSFDSSQIASANHEKQASQHYHRSIRTDDGMPPSSFPSSRALVSRPISRIPDKIRTGSSLSIEDDLHGTRESMDRQWNSLTDEVMTGTKASPNSQTPENTETGLFKKVEITPRSLIRPLQVPLPHSQTVGHLACVSSLHDTSATSTPRKHGIGQASNYRDDRVIRAAGVQSYGKITRLKSRLLNNIHVEAGAKPKDSNSVVSPEDLSSRTDLIAGSSGSQKPLMTINLPVNDVVNIRRLEEQRQKALDRPFLFVNTGLANTVDASGLEGASYSTPSSAATQLTWPSAASTKASSLSYVHSDQDSVYWTGRYMTTTDRLRKQDCDELLKPEDDIRALNVSSTDFESRYAKLENTRNERALGELRQCCMNETALKSFSHFETRLKENINMRKPALSRSSSDIYWKRRAERESTSLSLEELVNTKINIQIPSTANQASTCDLAELATEDGGFGKPKPASDLALSSKYATLAIPKLRRMPAVHNDKRSSMMDSRNLSGDRLISQSRAKASDSQESRLCPSHMLNEPDDDQSNLHERQAHKVNDKEEIRTLSHPFRWQHATRPQKIRASMEQVPVMLDMTPASWIKGKRLTMPTSYNSIRTIVTNQGHNKEAIADQEQQSRARISSQDSTEFVKKVMGASIREVRKMGRRVGSMGWGGNSDD